MIEAAYGHHGLDARYVNCDVAPAALGDAVRGARAMGWVGFNCSIPHKVAVIEHLDGVAESAEVIGAVNCVVRRDGRYIGENTDGVVVGRGPAGGGEGAARRSRPPGRVAQRPGLLAPIGLRWERLLAEAGSSSGRGRPTIAKETYVRLMIVKQAVRDQPGEALAAPPGGAGPRVRGAARAARRP
jgi:shikimate dehydrogenase-like protein